MRDARAEVLAVRHQTPRSLTLTLRPNSAWAGFRAGQFIRLGVEIDGVRRTRTYSPACSEQATDNVLELTVTVHPEGLVSRHLRSNVPPGAILHLGPAQGDFVLPAARPERLVLISGGSGATPVMSMLRTLCDEGHTGQIAFVHCARTAADWLYQSQTRELAACHPNLTLCYLATREGDDHLSAAAIRGLIGDLQGTQAAVCGPQSLIDAAREIWEHDGGGADRVLTETFTAPTLTVAGAAARGTVRFLRSDHSAAIGRGTLLEQAEAAGLSPDFGCRMGICHTCACRKAGGVVRNVLTGEISAEEDEDIQLCISVPAGDVALEL